MAANPVSAFPTLSAGTQTDSDLIYVVDVSAGLAGSKKQTFLEASATTTAPGFVNNTIQSFSGAKTFTAALTAQISATIGVVSTTTGTLTLANAASAFTTSFQAGAVAANRTYIWPAGDPTGTQTLAGTLSGATITLSYITTPTGSGVAGQVAFWSAATVLTGDVGFIFNGTTDTLTLGLASTSTGTVTLANSAGATTTSLQAGNAAATRNLILPVVDPTAGQALIAAAPSGANIQLSYATVPTISGGVANTLALWSTATNLTTAGALTNGQLFIGSTGAAPSAATPTVGTAGTDFAIATGAGTLTFNLPDASATARGVVTTGTQTLAGAKTFSSALTAQVSATLGVASSATGQLILLNATNGNTTTIQSGIAAASRVYTWPTNFGAAGSVLYDSAGNGTLSWTALSTIGVTSLQTLVGALTLLTGTTGPDFNITTDGVSQISLNIPDATASTRGFISTGTQTMAGAKTFSTSITSPTITATVQFVGTQGTLAGSSTPFISHTATWNNAATTFTNILSDVTDTASNANSLLLNLRVGGVTQFNITKGGQVTTAGAILAGSSVRVPATDAFFWNGQSVLRSSADGKVTLLNAAGTSFTALLFGGTGATMPALTVSTTGLQVTSADGLTPAFLQHKALISPKTASPVSVAALDTLTTYTNTGAAGSITFTLAAATGSGDTYSFIRDANQSMVVDAAGTDTIQVGASVTSAGGTVTLDAVGSMITICDAASGRWFSLYHEGSVTTA